ncbi:MAG: hypothetical protein CM1200mP2_36890 [Planctomycetaceae bacterium]|nr:MAG: hypothetical protein CM1200mP2_36890 [Planctomycetaceae bacterium]
MLRILGSNRRACDALSRRDMIQAGGASLLGLGLADLLHANEGNEPQLTRGFGRAKNVILLFLYGGSVNWTRWTRNRVRRKTFEGPSHRFRHR